MAAFVVAITGGIASGKSEVSHRFQQLGITIADADQAARSLAADEFVLTEIIARFGKHFLQHDGSLNRSLLRKHVFSDPQAKRDLETITHPRIRQLLQTQCIAANSAYVIVAIPLLAETGGLIAYPWLQRVLVVDAPLSIQRERLMARDGISMELAEEMIHSQASRDQRLALATDVIINDATSAALDTSVHRLDALYRKLAR